MMITYTVALRPDMNAVFHLPRDLTPKEVGRLKALLDTLPFPSGDDEDAAGPLERSDREKDG